MLGRLRHPRTGQDGFTIVELMIATTILSLILLLATVMILNMGNLFYKGYTQVRTQDSARNITEEISRHLQLSSRQPTIPATPSTLTIAGHVYQLQAYCIGTTRYSYVVGVQIGTGSGQIAHVLWRDTNSSGTCTPLDLTTTTNGMPNGSSADGTELIGPNSRLTALCIGSFSGGACTTSTASPFPVVVGVAYGDDDLMTNPHNSDGSQTCLGQSGDKFCATALLTVTVAQRLN